MEYSVFFTILVLLLVVGAFVHLCWKIILHFFEKFNPEKMWIDEQARNKYAGYLRNFRYYQQLSATGRKKFMNRLVTFMVNKRFVGMEGLQVTEQMKVLVAACAVQLTFGHKAYRLAHYHTIKIFPEPFYSRLWDAHLKGGTSKNGIILLSWKDFLHGYEHPEDKYNLGLHEMAHALKLDALNGYAFDEKFKMYLPRWLDAGKPEFEAMNRDKNISFLREYAATNMHEFFSVCVEHFFEVPEEFKRNLPDIYNPLSVLLNQDPLNAQQDYALKEDFMLTMQQDYAAYKKARPVSFNPIDSASKQLLIILVSVTAVAVLFLKVPQALIMMPLIPPVIQVFRTKFSEKGKE